MERIDIKKQLPYGVSLREILQHTSLTGASLKQLLRQRGVFIESNNDNTTIPLLITTLISTGQLEFIKERIKGKEDREKMYTRTLDWHSEQNLIASIPRDFNVNGIIQEAFPKYKIINATPFSMQNGDTDKIKMEFVCQTNNYNSSWYRTKSEFKGQLSLEKIKTKNEVYLRIKYTSPETQQIADKIAKTLEKSFKEQNLTKAPEMEKILYKNFTNDERVAFFLSLLSGNETFTFERTTHMGFAPDPNETLPDDFAWLEESKVKELNMDGEQLQQSPFVREKANHKFIEMADMEVQFKFTYHAAEGYCRVRFGFENYFKKRLTNIEFSADISHLSLSSDYAHVVKSNVTNFLLEEFDKLKLENYKLHSYRKTAAQFVP